MNIIEQLRRDEGWRNEAYQDSLGYWTIGCGFLIDARKGGHLDDEEIAWILQHRIDKTAKRLSRELSWFSGISDVRKAAFLNMAYQLGVSGLLKFRHTLEYASQGRWDDCAREALDSAWSHQTPRRAQRVAKQITTGEWQ